MTAKRKNINRVRAKTRALLRDMAKHTENAISASLVANGIPYMPGTAKHVTSAVVHGTRAHARKLSELLRNGNGKRKMPSKLQ